MKTCASSVLEHDVIDSHVPSVAVASHAFQKHLSNTKRYINKFIAFAIVITLTLLQHIFGAVR
jgi:hypothetical protein